MGKEHIWYLDSGCAKYMIRFKSFPEDFTKKDGPTITYGDNKKEATKGYGSIKCNYAMFKHVSYLMGTQHNIISISQLCDFGYDTLFNKRESKSHLNWLSNKRLYHLNFKKISKITWNQLVRGLPKIQCIRSGSLLRKKSHVAYETFSLIKQREIFLSSKVIQLCSDHGIEFRNSSVKDFCLISRISQNFLVVRTPQKNCIAKRRNKTHIDAGRTMVVEAGLLCLFGLKLSTQLVIPKIGLSLLSVMGKLPISYLREGKLDISYFHVYGCVCYIFSQRDQCSKFEDKADEGLFLVVQTLSLIYYQMVLSLLFQMFIKSSTHNLSLKISLIFSKEVEPSNPEDFSPSTKNEISNPRILRDKPKSQSIIDVNYGTLTRSRVCSNFYMSVNFVSMIEPKNVVDALKCDNLKFLSCTSVQFNKC
uniref:Retrovirus-related Pol polyprotein from transposon TNT 1-94-like beta-barrel domain-containing protein n=1 Tax=Lactuca sativa TaxID=4236 RepID=A0A9R1UN94_LACSA|nr:hypothetical protein LSAT_V11C800443110 [Lactuca sativa]